MPASSCFRWVAAGGFSPAAGGGLPPSALSRRYKDYVALTFLRSIYTQKINTEFYEVLNG
jgi:hypothetical protein